MSIIDIQPWIEKLTFKEMKYIIQDSSALDSLKSLNKE